MSDNTIESIQDALADVTLKLSQFNARFEQSVEASKKARLSSVLKVFKAVRDGYEAVDAERKRLNELIDTLSNHTIPEMMSEEGVKTITLEDVGRRFTVSTRLSASIMDKPRGYEWLKENGHDDLIQQTVNSSSLSAFCKSYMAEEGKDLPPDIFKVSLMQYTSITKV